MKVLYFLAVLPAIAAQTPSLFKVTQPPSRGQDMYAMSQGPCGGLDRPQSPTKIAAKQRFEFQVPYLPGSINLYYFSAVDGQGQWKPLTNITLEKPTEMVGQEIDFSKVARKDTTGTVSAQFIHYENSVVQETQFQCVDVTHGDDLKTSAAAAQRQMGMVALVLTTTVALIARL
ncbi:hypothetical protein H4R33_003175 [Dimargaris cristalligena]|uniref:Copper acquisition factor BIM1-like domain-containing protein n=1 Tax=Dimargaris cristalligena TaxID=215637 RepID=A0A4P9ZQ73_9FUNG|nr:hypothetical protein H4R33_003175 [Dimargaris cristalligena]RKP35415.1 hypothetical protein BJ085DRAFT_41301 [Dimargaris cristalligena]|eukprot:RKP35415.1 hypothetical protein BJ085DRAFT_41301 [Dimargaris cristalligena]